MNSSQLKYKNISILTKPLKGSKMTVGSKVDKTLMGRKEFKVKLKDSTYDLVPLMSLFLGCNVYNNEYFSPNYLETACLKAIHDTVKKEKYNGSVIQQKEGLINQYSDTWNKCVASVSNEFLDKRMDDYGTLLNVMLFYNPWECGEVWRYYTSYLANCYFRFLEEKKISNNSLLYALIDMCILCDTSSYYEEYKNGEMKYGSTRGIEFVLVNLLKYFLLEEYVDEDTANFLETFTNDISLCKFLKAFEVTEDPDVPINLVTKVVGKSDAQDFSDVLAKVYCSEYDYGNNMVKKTNDKMYTYAIFIMRSIDELFHSRVCSIFSYLEQEGVSKARYEVEASKDAEIKKLNSTIKKLHKSVESYKFTDTKSKELIKELRLKASNNAFNDVIRSKDVEIEELKKKLAEKDTELVKVKSKLDSTQKRVDTLESRELKLNEEAENTIRDLEEELENLDTLCAYYESSLNDTTHKSFDDYRKGIQDLKICVIGGPNGFEKRLETLSKNITHVNIKECNYSYEIPQCDLIISNSSINSHSHEATARKVAKSRGIGFMRTQITNIELLAKIIYQYKLTL